MRPWTPRRWYYAIAILAALMFAMALLHEVAFALCLTPEEDGVWVNADPNTRGITKIQLRFVCQDQVRNGELYPPGPPWYVHLWGACLPSDCDWNEVGAQELNSGFIYAVYDQGFAKRYVYARMSQYRSGQLWVWIWTDFKDANRPDYGMHNWFVHQ